MIAIELIKWYKKNKRDLPWRETTDSYPIWLSEVILQQTRVLQGLPYYEKFLRKYPSVCDLAAAEESEVLRIWQGLGYYSRARNLLKTAQIICNEYSGKFPKTYADLLKLKGIGTYTAAAIASFANKEVVPVVDGNVFRVISRLYSIALPIDKPSTKQYFFDLSKTLISVASPDLYNQAIMELGATVCKPKKPDCHLCPLRSLCLSSKEKTIDKFPFKEKKIKVQNRLIKYICFKDDNKNILLKKRDSSDIWSNLYDFPEFEIDNLEKHIEQSFPEILNYEIKGFKTFNHILTHRKLEIQVFTVLTREIKEKHNLLFYDEKAVDILPKPIIIKNIIDIIFSEF